MTVLDRDETELVRSDHNRASKTKACLAQGALSSGAAPAEGEAAQAPAGSDASGNGAGAPAMQEAEKEAVPSQR